VDDADGGFLAAGSELAVVEADLGSGRAHVGAHNIVLFSLVAHYKIGALCFLDDVLGYLAASG
jgi:hypothetical protein